MAYKKEKKPPQLTGFSSKGAGRGEPLTNPSTTLWMAIMFVAILFAIYGAKRNWQKAEEKVDTQLRYSPYLSDAPDKKAEINPPPDPRWILDGKDEDPILPEEIISMRPTIEPVEVRPIDVDLKVGVPVLDLTKAGNPD